MKSFIFLSFTIFALNLANATLPGTGIFEFSLYNEKTCSENGHVASNNYKATSPCWSFSPYSFSASDWNSATNSLTFGAYSSDSTCSVLNKTFIFKCDGTCYLNPSVASYFTCLYKNTPTTGAFNYTSFSDDSCNNWNSYTKIHLSTEMCWTTEEMGSVYPTSYDSTSNLLSVWSFTTTRDCLDFTVPITQSTLTCDGSCQSGSNSDSFICSYTDSAKLIFSMVLIFIVMLILV